MLVTVLGLISKFGIFPLMEVISSDGRVTGFVLFFLTVQKVLVNDGIIIMNL